MNNRLTILCCAALLAVIGSPSTLGAELAPPVVEGPWLRPANVDHAEPRWGFADGMQVGIQPLNGPRGLLRVYAPYLGHPRHRVINFIAVEPIVVGQSARGLSELEPSQLDGVAGKRFWSADSPTNPSPQPPDRPARGVIESVDGVEQLRLYIFVERFLSGAHLYLQLRFRADRPQEVGIAVHRVAESAPLDYAIVTATMGNFARLRRLHLAHRIVTPEELWPDFAGDDFTPHARFPLAELPRNSDDDIVISATTDEVDPAAAAYAPGVHQHWKYYGKKAVQTWRAANPHGQLEALVNCRRVYWASRAPIPNGASFENFELAEPFREGREFYFSVEPEEKK
jgi:hypothetical protein